MTKKERYKELIEENNNVLNALSDDYRKVGYNYVKKARGYAVKSLDTEIRIKEVLEELTSFDENKLSIDSTIPNMTEYIEGNVAKLSKAPTTKAKIKEIVAVSLFILGIASYFVINAIANKPKPLATPTNIVATITTDNTFELSWDNNSLAKEGYYIIIYINEEKVSEKFVPYSVDSITKKQIAELKDLQYEEGKVYRFDIYAKATDNFKSSNIVTYKYPNNLR